MVEVRFPDDAVGFWESALSIRLTFSFSTSFNSYLPSYISFFHLHSRYSVCYLHCPFSPLHPACAAGGRQFAQFSSSVLERLDFLRFTSSSLLCCFLAYSQL